ncbi:YtxH domain-containing protein [Flavobacterium crassostreae]|uniref:Gas vesicle protein n=1 Tax=Flavobacterium crassostreae TaxID=1763534 RepID=A0A1B9E281_9FLAO|nr:YtxH domain-containing protein [Flavobacterium crassostreae]OCB76054.1 gas vesicle protein [Flavobacterium crassostreae]
MKTDNVILGVLGGLAAGAILGILYAPDKGEKTRKRIKDKSMDCADDLKCKLDAVVENISEKYNDLKKESKEMYAEGKSKIEQAHQDLENQAKNLKA